MRTPSLTRIAVCALWASLSSAESLEQVAAPRDAASALAQSTPAVPQFATRAEAITVDVVVLDKAGQPIEGLSKDDFTLLEDGRPQTIVGFESRALSPAAPAGPEAADHVASNEGSPLAAGRALAFLIDDLGIEPLHMTEVAQAISRWLDKGADPRDEVTLTTVSRDAWWSATVGDGREDLEAVLRRMNGKKNPAASHDAMSDWEAYQIDALGSPIEPPRQSSGPPTGSEPCTTNGPLGDVFGRVVDRWFRTRACICDPMNTGASIASCRSQVGARARQVYSAASRRAVDLLGAVERLSRGFSSARGRKSIVILSPGLLRDTDRAAFERAVDASRRGNTSVSFIDVRGLIGQPFASADQPAPPRPDEIGVVSAEIRLAETGGGESLAETTGGSMLRDTNDLAGAVRRVADESSVYYLLGYQSDRPLDGSWRKLQVKVSRPGLSVRARKGYFATAEPPRLAVSPASKAESGKKARDEPRRPLDPALAVGGERDDLPLRMVPHVFELDAAGRCRVLVVAEVDTSKLTFSGTGKERTARLDVAVLGVSRDQPTLVPLDSGVTLSVDEATVGAWWIFSRELRLPSGAAQVRLLVRDQTSGRTGLVAQRIEVPHAGTPYLSTPILTDRLARDRGGQPRIMPVAHRRFQARGSLYCAYEVYVAPGREELSTMPDVLAGYTLADDAGHLLTSPPPSPIALGLGAQLVRTLVIPLEGLAPGRYELSIHASDEKRGLDLTAREAFVVDPPAGAAAFR